MAESIRNLIIVLGDQLDDEATVFENFDTKRDAIWMAEVRAESEYVWATKPRIAIFLAAMRHFRNRMKQRHRMVFYMELEDENNRGSIADQLAAMLAERHVQQVSVTQPGEWRLQREIGRVCDKADVPLEIVPDRMFLSTPEEFRGHAEGRKTLRMEYFYREMRKRYDVLMVDGKKGPEPEGGDWNYDSENRESFGKEGPGELPEPPHFPPNKLTKEVLAAVERQFEDHPGSLEHFAWPVTPDNAQKALRAFIRERLPNFGDYQDAMWTDEPFLYHSLISSCLNLKLLDPRDAIEAAETAYRQGDAPLAAVEGFIRQILGWREYVRGVYWMYMPEYLERNELDADQPLPHFYWTGDTPMECLRQSITQTLEYGYAHHIQRLMVTGLYALLLGVHPKQVHEWYLAVYVDAVEWVELPNTLGMSQYGDGGVMGSKPYAATGKYIKRMSNYCKNCRFKPDQASGDDACPFTSLYWDFLARNYDQLKSNQRMALQVKNIDKKKPEDLKAIRARASKIRQEPSAKSLVEAELM